MCGPLYIDLSIVQHVRYYGPTAVNWRVALRNYLLTLQQCLQDIVAGLLGYFLALASEITVTDPLGSRLLDDLQHLLNLALNVAVRGVFFNHECSLTQRPIKNLSRPLHILDFDVWSFNIAAILIELAVPIRPKTLTKC